MAQPLVVALDFTEAVSALLGGIALAYHRQPAEVGDALEELADLERIADSSPGLVTEGMNEARREVLSRLLGLACKTD